MYLSATGIVADDYEQSSKWAEYEPLHSIVVGIGVAYKLEIHLIHRVEER